MRWLFAALHRRPRLALLLLLAAPALWLGVVYLGALFSLLVQSFFHLDGFTGQVVRTPSLATWRDLLTRPHLEIVLRTVTMAAAVTVAAAVLAFPLAYYMARCATPRLRAFLTLAVVMPLWSSYLVRVYFWKLILAREGVVSWFCAQLGLSGLLEAVLSLPGVGGPSLSVSPLGTFVAFVYVWLPYMILPAVAALERIPRSLLEASADLGARPLETFRNVVLPMARPGLLAGSIFTFSLTFGDFVVPGALGDSSLYLGQAVLAYQGTAGNIPLAAAFTAVPALVMAAYLAAAQRLRAFDAL